MNSFTRCICIALTACLACKTTAEDMCTTNQWVRLSDVGRLSGDIVMPMGESQFKTVGRADLALVDVSGNVKTARSNSKGRFTIRGIEPGIYTIAASQDGFLGLMSLHVLAADQPNAQDYPERLTLSVAELDLATARGAMSRYMSGDSSSRPGTDRFSEVDFINVADKICRDDVHRVMQTDGGMSGHIYLPGLTKNQLQPAALTNVIAFRNGAEAARSVTDESGGFEFADLEPGPYGLLAAGASGFAVTGFELVAENATGNSGQVGQMKRSNMTLVQKPTDAANEFGVQLSDGQGAQKSLGAAADPDSQRSDPGEQASAGEPQTPMAGLSIPPGSYVGGGSGGGGAVSGGGELGGLAGLAGIGGIIAATAGDDDDNNFVQPAPASQANP